MGLGFEWGRSVLCQGCAQHLDDRFLPKAPIATRWIKYVPIKLNVFAWKVHLDRLPTRVNLQHRGVLVLDPLCPICCSEDEVSAHIFFQCRYTHPCIEVSQSALYADFDQEGKEIFVTKHKLKEHKKITLMQQKQRGMAHDRSVAASKEVEELKKAEILRV
nr:RNA-directed DNA polymerase, eukaryota [Tanacetum cinerariifolium]